MEKIREISDLTVSDVDIRDRFHRRHLNRGVVPSDWAEQRNLVNATLGTIVPVFDLSNPTAVQEVREQLAVTLLALGVDDLDFADVLGRRRDATQAISRWIWTMTDESEKLLFAGIRYRSRFDPECICLALYEGRFSNDGPIDIQPITSTTPGFAEAAAILRLEIS